MTTINAQYLPINVQNRKDLDLRTGDTVRVTIKIVEKGKTRLQAFEGLVIARKHGRENGGTFTVRRVASGVGVERIFPLYSPSIESIEILKRARVRHSKIYFIRDMVMRKIRYKLRRLLDFSGSTSDLDPVEVLKPTDEAEVKAEDMEEAKQQEEVKEAPTELKEEKISEEEAHDIESSDKQEEKNSAPETENTEEKKEEAKEESKVEEENKE